MRVLVYPASMEIGGSQVNALQLADGAARRGHEVVLFGPDGVLLSMAERLGLEHVRAPRERSWPSPRNMLALRRLVRERGIDLVHGYEWGPALDLAFGVRTPLVMTVLSMSVAKFLPTHGTLVVGTRELADAERARRSRVHLIEPPIDTDENAPAGDRVAARRRFGLVDDDIALVVVCRLTSDLGKLEGILEATEVVDRLGAELPLRLLVVGDGDGLPAVRARAETVNGRLGRAAIEAVGPLLDPRDAYEAADVVLGMGGSALKGLAFAKPLVVQGERGFWELLDEGTAPRFLQQGWWGTGTDEGPAALEDALRSALARRDRWGDLGALGRELVLERYSLRRAAERQVEIYEQALAQPPSAAETRAALARSAYEVAKFKTRMAQARATELRTRGPRPAVAR